MKDESVIPMGSYCYTWIKTPSTKNNYRGTTEVCPYWELTYNGDSAYCHFLDLDDSLCLWDQVKCCGIKDFSEEEYKSYIIKGIV